MHKNEYKEALINIIEYFNADIVLILEEDDLFSELAE